MRDEVKPLHLQIDVSDLPAWPQTPLKLLTSHHQHVFSIVKKKCPMYCLWLTQSKSSALRTLGASDISHLLK